MSPIIQKITANREKINIVLFYIAYTIMIFFWMFTNVKYISAVNNYLIKLSYGIIILSCFFAFSKNDIKDKKNIFLFVALIFSLVSWAITDSSTIAVLILFIIAAKNIKFNDIIKYDFKLRILFTAIVVLLYILNLTEDYYMYREDGTIRSSMGFAHPNTFGIYVFLICAEFIYLNYEKITWKHYLVLFIATILLSYFTDSRASVITIILLILGVFLCQKTKNKIIENKIVKNLMLYLFIILTIVSFIMCIFYNPENKVLNTINEMLTGRINLINEILKEERIRLFGKNLELVGEEEAQEKGIEARVLDNTFIKIILQDGLLNYICIAIMLYIAIRQSLKEKNYIYGIIMTIYIIRGLTGNGLYSLHTNTFLIYISNAIYMYNKKEKYLIAEENKILLEEKENKKGHKRRK